MSPQPQKPVILSLKGVSKTFSQVKILDNANLDVHAGEIISIFGSSGCGKTTLLQIAGLLASPDSGSLLVCGKDCGRSDAEKTTFRRCKLGYIYQFHHLLADLSVLNNVAIPGIIKGLHPEVAREKALETLEEVKIAHLSHKSIGTLSGGERQRTAIARALAFNPSIVIADEPTGNLDPQNASLVFKLLVDLADLRGAAVIVATHNYDLLPLTHRQIRLLNGKLQDINKPEHQSPSLGA